MRYPKILNNFYHGDKNPSWGIFLLLSKVDFEHNYTMFKKNGMILSTFANFIFSASRRPISNYKRSKGVKLNLQFICKRHISLRRKNAQKGNCMFMFNINRPLFFKLFVLKS